MKYLLTGGDTISLNAVSKILESDSNIKIVNCYGPTENGSYSACFTATSNWNKPYIPIGKPIANSTAYIVSKDGSLLPFGCIGELWVGGDGISKGYVGLDELTTEKFVKSSFTDEILYKTGDLAQYDEYGNICFLGRMDSQVKIRGYRIELNEINNTINKFPGITESISIVKSINGSKKILSFFVAEESIDIDSLKEFLSKHLPDYMVPFNMTQFEKFPLTPNGKIDRKALDLSSSLLSMNDSKYVAPKTELQKKLVSIFEQILNTKHVGINDNFFELGGDSLLAMNLNIEIQKISTNITYSDIFHFATVAELEERIYAKDTNELLLKKIENLSDSFLGILKDCTKKDKIRKCDPNNVLITGCTGFLGIHILKEFIDKEKGNIYCIVRDGRNISAKERLRQKLNYYFGNKYDGLIDKRIFTLPGSITEPYFGLSQSDLLSIANSVDVVINSAARVAHFGNYKDFYDSNVKSVKYIIDFCRTFDKTLYHISTISVGGMKLDLSYPVNKIQEIEFNESSLYIGQILDIVYSRTKFEAEECMLEAISQGLDGYIIRMGNLMPRYSDGVFQENISDNGFINRIISFMKLGMVPDTLINYPLEFAPIDYAAKAIHKLVKYRANKNRIFILYNHNTVPVNKLIKVLSDGRQLINVLPEDEFIKEVRKILDNETSKHLLDYLINDFDKNYHLNYNLDININSNFTIKYLKKKRFRWPKITNRYLTNFSKLLRRVIKDDRYK